MSIFLLQNTFYNVSTNIKIILWLRACAARELNHPIAYGAFLCVFTNAIPSVLHVKEMKDKIYMIKQT